MPWLSLNSSVAIIFQIGINFFFIGLLILNVESKAYPAWNTILLTFDFRLAVGTSL